MFYDYINIKRNILILLNKTFFQPKAFFFFPDFRRKYFCESLPNGPWALILL